MLTFDQGANSIDAFFTPPFALILGLCIGSFLNVCILRLHAGGNIAIPASSRCPRCKHPLSWFENIPLLGYLLLRGRCRHCHKPISIQYPLVEGVTGLLFMSATLVFPAQPVRVLMTYFGASFIVLLVVSDIKWLILPHPFNNLFAISGLVFSGMKLTGGGWTLDGSLLAVEGFVGAGTLLILLGSIFPKGIGGGDVKMVAAIGAWLGLSKVLITLLFAFGAGALLALPLLAVGKVGRKTMLPFGPFLGGAALFVWYFPGAAQFLLDRMS